MALCNREIEVCAYITKVLRHPLQTVIERWTEVHFKANLHNWF